MQGDGMFDLKLIGGFVSGKLRSNVLTSLRTLRYLHELSPRSQIEHQL